MRGVRSPVALFLFNRPGLTERVFRRIREQRPDRLLIVADGAREDVPGEAELCAAARSIVERVDWPAEVVRNYSSKNLGCRKRMSSGISWVFDQCEEAILLEDDCVPDPSFFRYCDELLERYRSEERIAMIGGAQLQRNVRVGSSYYFTRFPHIWGWATWRRAWAAYDVEMRAWPEMRDSGWLERIFGDSPAAARWRWLFDETYEGRIDTWDFQWVFSCWRREALSILPKRNLISNLGFGPEATNTRKPDANAGLATHMLSFPLVHPPRVARDKRLDARSSARVFDAPEGGYAAQLPWRIRRRTTTVPASLRRMMRRMMRG